MGRSSELRGGNGYVALHVSGRVVQSVARRPVRSTVSERAVLATDRYRRDRHELPKPLSYPLPATVVACGKVVRPDSMLVGKFPLILHRKKTEVYLPAADCSSARKWDSGRKAT